ncbi:MAG: hypothetical protein NVS2B7_30650 [Herpetosiphon sp.]
MSMAVMARVAFLVFTIPMIVYYVRRQYQGQDTLGKRVIPKILLATVLSLLADALSIPRPMTWPIRTLCITFLFYSICLAYLAIHQLINSTLRQPVLRHPLFWLTTMGVAVETILIYHSRTNLGSLVDAEPIRPTMNYALYYGLMLVLPMGIGILCIMDLWVAMQKDRGITYTVYAVGSFVTFSLEFITASVGLINLCLFFVVGDMYRQTLNVVFSALRSIAPVPALVLLIPKPTLQTVLRPIQALIRWRGERQKQDLSYLNQRMSLIVQCVDRMPPEYWSTRRLLTELGDARDALWSHIPHLLPLSAQQEADYLARQLQEHRTITLFGPSGLPPARANTIRHNVAVARYLRKFEQGLGSPMHTLNQLPTIPEVASLPLIGNVLDIRRDLLAFLLRVSGECGDIGVFHFGRRPIVLVNGPEYVAAILVEQSDKLQKTPRARSLLRTMLGHSLITQERSAHKRQRRLVAPAFQHRRIATYAEVITTYTTTIRDAWADQSTIDIVQELLRLTLWISGKTLFNADILREAPELHAAMTTTLRYGAALASTLLPIPVSWPTPASRRFRTALTRLDQTLFPLIAERRISGHDHGDLLSMLLQTRDADDGTALTDQEVRDESLALFVAGHENTAFALAWAWVLVLQHPAVYARLQAEVNQVLAGRPPTVDDLHHLPYTAQVFKEALRLYPPAYILNREAVEPIALPDGRYLPVGTAIGISPYTLHRRSDTFPDPQRFDPDRWSPEREALLPRYAYLPFGAGPHICIGNHYAMMEGQLILATLAQHVLFDLAPNQKIVPEALVTLRPHGSIKVVVQRTRTSPAIHATVSEVEPSLS